VLHHVEETVPITSSPVLRADDHVKAEFLAVNSPQSSIGDDAVRTIEDPPSHRLLARCWPVPPGGFIGPVWIRTDEQATRRFKVAGIEWTALER